jgi:patatin-related protein
MYGGVSLAVYINGVTRELFNMVRATAPRGDPMTGQFRFSRQELTGTEAVYRDIAAALQVRFVIDILSGTSAGGINALYLAKALVRDQSLDGVKRLWVREGELAKLLNDGRSLEGGLPNDLLDDPPQSLLNGRRFYWQLLSALEEMDEAAPPAPGGNQVASPYGNQLDLYITATDFSGVPLPIQLADEKVDEPVYRKIFHFRYWHPAQGSCADDFQRDTNPMLAFAARCTASFPGAFVPFKLSDIDPILSSFGRYQRASEFLSSADRWRRFFPECPGEYQQRFFVDGGYLDNKPFEAAIRALRERHPAVLPVERRLIYIEPDPERYARARVPEARPDLVSNLLAVVGLPGVETIRAEVDEVTERNRLLARAAALTEGLGEDVEVTSRKQVKLGFADDWALGDLRDLVDLHGVAYGGYHRLKVAKLTEWLAVVCHRVMTRPGRPLALEDVQRDVEAWRKAKFKAYYDSEERERLAKLTGPRQAGSQATLGLPATENRFLVDFDLAYRMRRIEFVRLKLREIAESFESAEPAEKVVARIRPIERSKWENERPKLLELQQSLQRLHEQLVELDRTCLLHETAPGSSAQALKDALQIHRAAASPTVAAILGTLQEHMPRFLKQIGDGRKSALGDDSDVDDRSAISAIRAALRHIYETYDDFDLVRFPVLHVLGTEELDEVKLIRISAADATLAGTRGASKLAGVKLGHFGAFLDETWRKNDILWGRLDGAERLITTLVPASTEEQKKQRDAWLLAAFKAIIREELGDRLPQPVLPGALGEWGQIEAARPEEPQKAKQQMAAFLERQAVNDPISPERTLHLVGRSTAIVRDVLSGMAAGRGQADSTGVKWLVNVLSVLWGFVELATPGSLGHLFVRHWLRLVTVAAMLLAAVGWFFDLTQQRNIGLSVIAAAIVIQLGAVGLKSTLSGKGRPFGIVFALLGLATSSALFVWLVPKVSGVSPSESVFDMLDFELARTPERVAKIFADWGEHHFMGAVTSAVRWDFLFIVAYVVLMASVSWLVGNLLAFGGKSRGMSVASWLVGSSFVAGVCDAAENGLLLWLLAHGPLNVRSSVPALDRMAAQSIPFLAFGFSSLKFGLVFVVLAANLFGLAVGLVFAAGRVAGHWRRARRSSSSAPAR